MKQIGGTTILVAVLNKLDTIKICTDSLLALKNKPKRILILDGGSTDGTYEILKKYGKKIDLKQFPGTGLSWRINWALDHIDTKYTAMTDADCVVEPDWLEKLVGGFKQEKNLVATAGYCGTPRNTTLLQRMIGYEMDNRFNRLPKYLYRAPTMNLCLVTKIARQVKFDETQLVAVETDFGFRLSKYGKILYVPEAKIWHYHRSSLMDYFKQQKSQAQWAFRLIFRHKKRAISDPITTLSMTAQIPLLSFGLFFLILSLFFPPVFIFALITFFLLFIIYLKNILEIKPPLIYYPLFIMFFIFRTFSWTVGVTIGIPALLKIKHL